MPAEQLLQVNDLVKYHRTARGPVHAVDHIDLTINSGETLGIVGESGCGKSTLGRTLVRLAEPDSGQIIFAGQDITHKTRTELHALRRQLQIVFQDPFSSLNPRRTIRQTLREPFQVHRVGDRSAQDELVQQLISRVGLHPSFGERYPHELSGGQRQRIAIARAIALEPRLVICDEPVSALDVSVQAQIINLLRRLQKEMGTSYVFISHDLSVVGYLADRIAVMYMGEIVEIAPKQDIWNAPAHPYTQALFSAISTPEPPSVPRRKRVTIEGDIPSPINPPPGCRFQSRCPLAMPICKEVKPLLRSTGGEAKVACHLANPQ